MDERGGPWRWGEDDSGTPILHVDMDAFFASVEVAARPGLRGRAMVVGGRERGVVLAATYEARAFGIRSGMPMATAIARLPSVIVVPPDHESYRRVSRQVMAVLAEITPQLQQVSVDEAFLDVSGARRRLGSPARIGTLVRERVRREVGLPISVGIASTMFVAKVASTRAKPDGMLLVPEHATVDFLHALPVAALWGVGESTASRLADLGIRTVAELATAPRSSLAARLGPAAAHRLHDLAWGRDPRVVTPERTERSVSAEHTFPVDVTDRAELARTALAQTHTCARRLREAGMLARGVTLKVRLADFTTLTRSRRLDVPTDVAAALHGTVRALLAAVDVPATGVRLIGVRADDLVVAAGTPVQATLGDDGDDRRALEVAVDAVDRRFGGGAAVAASLLQAPPVPATQPTPSDPAVGAREPVPDRSRGDRTGRRADEPGPRSGLRRDSTTATPKPRIS
ncbi:MULTISPECIES: DNA polymerase IV [Miniimonas]|nr:MULTISPECIES: DNA polymerase IV [Miniimonas]